MSCTEEGLQLSKINQDSFMHSLSFMITLLVLIVLNLDIYYLKLYNHTLFALVLVYVKPLYL